MQAWRNPPPEFLEAEIARFPDWLVWDLLISPRLEIYQIELMIILRNEFYNVFQA